MLKSRGQLGFVGCVCACLKNQTIGRQRKMRSTGLKGEVRRKMNFTYVLGFLVVRDVVKVFPVSSSSFVRKTTGSNQARSHSGA